MADNTITWCGIRSLGSLLYICGILTSLVKRNNRISQKSDNLKKKTEELLQLIRSLKVCKLRCPVHHSGTPHVNIQG